ncbi:MAG: LAGLIDADG family homing endonuclease [Campylobacterota bacterium]|nr:LAGLIDADG family homing endonuclease [Campylobacterota bacterium]
MMIRKRNGRQEIIDISKIQKHTISATENLTGVSQSELEIDSRIKFIEGMSSTDIHDSLIKTAVEKIDIDVPNWTFVAARLFLFDLYHRVGRATHGIKGNAYCHLKDYIKYGQDAQRIITNLEDGYDLEDLNNHLKPERDYLFNYLGIKTIYDRYLLKNNNKEPIELPQQMFMGISMFLAQNETNKQEKAKEFYDVLSKFEVMLATPTLSNARTTRHQLSSCFIKGTKVRTIDGYKDIDKIELGDMVLTHKNRFMKVYELFKRDYARNLISLDINGLIKPLEATEEHPILSMKKDDISCIRKLGNCILNQNNHRYCFSLKGEYKNDCELLNKEFSSSWNKIEDLNKGDFVSISYPKYKGKDTIYISDYIQTKNLIEVDGKMLFKRSSKSFYSVGRSFLNNQIQSVTNKIKLSKNFMLLIGYFLAEGHISKDKSSISFTFGSKEISYIEETKNILEDIFDVKVCININKDNSTNVVVHSKILALFFYELVGTGFDKKILNNDILFANPKVQKWLLVSAIRGDGCALSEGYQLTMSNEKLIQQLFEISLRCGLSPYMKNDNKKSRLATVKATHLKIGVNNDKSFILDVNKNIEKINLDSKSKSALRYFWFKDEYFMKIIDKDSTYLEDKVYNIEVEDDHSYSVSGVNVHNCYVGSSSDNIEGIFDAYKEMALLSKFGGGIGWDWNSIRSIGGVIDGHKGAAGGTVPFLKITNDIALAVDQLGCVERNTLVEIIDNIDNTLEEKTTIKKISECKIGEYIASMNIENNKKEFRKIEMLHEPIVKYENQIRIIFDNNDEYTTSTWHPTLIYNSNNKLIYKRADEIKISDKTIDSNGNIAIVSSIDYEPKANENYFDLTVQGTNNYFCSTHGKHFHVVHNTRKGAIAVYLEPWHMDIMDFIDLKKNNGEERRRAHDLFPALWINDLFMQRILEDGNWSLFDPYEVKDLATLTGEEFQKRYEEYENDYRVTKKQIKAKELWKKVLTSYFESGSPFLCFKDTANKTNPNSHNGFIRSSNLCVTGDTRLHTQYGLVKAKELEEMNKKVIATCDNRTNFNRKEYGIFKANCLEVYKTKENAKIYEIETYDGYTIKCTNWHEFYVNRDKEIKKLPLKDMKLTDKLLIQSDEGQFGNFGTYDEGLILGLITGDGTFSKTNSGKPLAILDLFNDEMECLKDSIHLKLNKLLNENKPLNKILKNSNNSDKIRFTSTTLAKLLDKKYDFNKETKIKVPENIFKGSKQTVVGYLQGIYTTDGTVNILRSGKNKTPSFSVQLSNIDLKYLQDIQILLSNFGIRSKINDNRIGKRVCFDYTTKSGEYKEYTSNGTYRIDINGRNATKFIDTIGFLSNKQTRCLKILEERKVLGLSRESKKSEYFEVKIKRIEYIGREDVYDTTQLVNNSLIFNGIVTGNCTEIFQNTEANHYLIKVELENGQIVTFEEDEEVTVDSGLVKKANKLTALDKLYGEKIFIIEKEKIDGKTAVCNLASVNLSKINKETDINRVVPIAIRMLDNVIDLNFYPLRKVKVTNLQSRAIGLGIMGESQMLAESQIQWGSEEHFKKIDSIMEAISYNAIDASSNLGVEKGVYSTFEGSKWSEGIMPMDHTKDEVKTLFQKDLFDKSNYNWDILREKVKKQGMRNGYLMSIAPTSSISILVGTTQAIEPVYKRKWYEENLSGQIPVVVPNLSAETWEYYTPAYEVNQFDIIKAAAIRQKWIDQGQSTNIFISLDKASGKYLHEIYTLAWQLGLKSTYYLRSQSPEAQEEVVDRSMECVGCQ